MGSVPTVRNIRVGNCKMTYTPTGGQAITIGFTKDGLVLKVKREKEQRFVHELGKTPIGGVWNGCTCKGTITLREWSLDNVAMAFGSTKTTVAGTPSKTSVDITPLAGGLVPTGAFTFHPEDKADSDVSEDVVLPMVEVDVDSDYAFQVTADRDLKFNFEAIASFNEAEPTKLNPLVIIGDESTGVTFLP